MADAADAIKQAIRDKAQALAEEAAALAFQSVQNVCPRGEADNLYESLEVDPVEETAEGVFETKIRATASYASFTDTGAAEHVEEGSPVLSFAWPEDPRGRDRSAFRSVTIPAQTGTHWFSEPMADVWDSAVSEVAASG